MRGVSALSAIAEKVSVQQPLDCPSVSLYSDPISMRQSESMKPKRPLRGIDPSGWAFLVTDGRRYGILVSGFDSLM